MKYKDKLFKIAKKNGRTAVGLMTIPFWAKLEKLRDNASILCYHRVAPMDKKRYDQSNLVIPPDLFANHLAFLSSKFNVISMDQLFENIKNKRSLKNCIAITFDDGYLDFQQYAVPLLRKLNLPATVYLCTDFLDGTGILWWHLIDEILVCGKKINFSWNNKCYSLEPDVNIKGSYDQLRSLFMDTAPAFQNLLADKLLKVTGLTKSSKYKFKMMGWNDIVEFKNDPLISIGAHTKSHCALAKQHNDDVMKEMTTNKCILEDYLNRSVDHFAYPFGTIKEAGEREYLFARNVGFSSGVTLIKGHIDYEKVDRFSIPRFHVPGGNFSVNQLRFMLSGLEIELSRLILKNYKG